MKKAAASILFFLFFISAQAQQLFIQYGPVLSVFNYKNSEGGTLSELKSSAKSSIEAGGRISILQSPAHISFGLSNDRFASTSSDPVLGNYSEWDVSFLGINLAADYEFFKPKIHNIDRNGFSFCIRTGMTSDLLLSGKQRINSQVFDLKNVEEFDKPFWFIRGGIVLNYYFTRSYKAYMEYLFGQSLLFGDYSNQEQLRFTTHSIAFGFSVDLFYKRDK